MLDIGLVPYSYDEIISVKDTLLDFGHIKHESEWDTNPPFYYYCLWIWEKVFGLGEANIRSFSALFNSLTLLVMGSYLWKNFGKSTSVAFIFLFSLHPILNFYAQEARCYSLLLFLISLAIITFHSFITSKTKLSFLLLGLINFLLIYTHYLSSIFILVEFLFCLIFQREKVIKFILSNLVVLFLVFIRFTKKQIQLVFGVTTDSVKGTWIKRATFNDLINFFDTVYFSVFIYLIIILIALYLLIKSTDIEPSKLKMIYFSFMVSILSPIILYLIGRLTPVFIGRYLLFSVICSIVIFSFVIVNHKPLGYLILVLFIVLELVNLKLGESKGIDYRSVAKFAKSVNNRPLIIINRKDVTELFTYYYDIELFKRLKYNDKSELNKLNIFDATKFEDFIKIDVSNQRLIMLFQTFDDSVTNSMVYDWLITRGYKMDRYDIFKGAKFILFTKS